MERSSGKLKLGVEIWARIRDVRAITIGTLILALEMDEISK